MSKIQESIFEVSPILGSKILKLLTGRAGARILGKYVLESFYPFYVCRDHYSAFEDSEILGLI